ncbi:uroporphyrinogen-III synthase [Acuticoccus sp.]|uniref:uroporphyrinogen-III synthase n=1 Tax=Acuticoccus sp. TaxID=1904378 RepID=UPI003B52035A
MAPSVSAVVAVTRPRPQADDTVRRLRRAGYGTVAAPLLTAEVVAHPGTAGGIGTIALTSRTAASILACHPRFHHLPVYAVGDATAREARRAGFARVTSASGDVTALAVHLAEAPQPIVHLAGQDNAGALVETLLARGQRAERRVIYAMRPATALPSVPRVDAVLLASPRTAATYAALAVNAPWREAPCVALSAAVAAEVADRRVLVARRPDEDALLEALAELCCDA